MNSDLGPAIYARVPLSCFGRRELPTLRSFEELGAALCANVTRLERSPALDTEAATRAKVEKSPYSVQKVGRAALKPWIEPLADYLAKSTPPRGLEQVLRGLADQQLAFLALRAILDQIHFGWDKDRRKRAVKNPDMLFRVKLGQSVRDELEFAGLLGAQKYVKAARNKHAALGKLKFRRVDWARAECARVGDWLWDALAQMSCFSTDARGYPCIHPDHRAALDKLAEEVLFDHPLYKPKLTEPPAWTDWRVECPGDIGATFVKTNDPETVERIQAAFVSPPGDQPVEFEGSLILPDPPEAPIMAHARAVSAIQSVPLRINPAMVPLVREFAGNEYRRDVVVAEAIGEQTFWNRVRCDRRGRLIQMCDFNYTRDDPVRSLFMFAKGKRIGRDIDWLEIAIANAYRGHKDIWDDRNKWVADNHELIKAVAIDPRSVWPCVLEAKKPFQFVAACIEYVAADTHGPTYETHLPVWLDASSNGLQHIAIMMRDRKLAAMVNLKTGAGDDIAIQNVYEIVARHEQQDLYADEPSRIWLRHASSRHERFTAPRL